MAEAATERMHVPQARVKLHRAQLSQLLTAKHGRARVMAARLAARAVPAVGARLLPWEYCDQVKTAEY